MDIVRFLVQHNADINAQDNEGWTPLHTAVCCGNLNIAKYLYENVRNFKKIYFGRNVRKIFLSAKIVRKVFFGITVWNTLQNFDHYIFQK